jgi:hypothetical protein
MRRLPLLLIMVGGLGALAPAVHADDEDVVPVSWSAQGVPAAVVAGQPFALRLHAAILPGWHLYALSEPPNGPIATEVGLAEGDAPDLVSVDETAPVERYDPVFAHLLRFHEKQADFSLKLSTPAGTAPGAARVHLLARYQACSPKICLPPRTASVEVALTVRAPAAG